jgi:hypothetical protein
LKYIAFPAKKFGRLEIGVRSSQKKIYLEYIRRGRPIHVLAGALRAGLGTSPPDLYIGNIGLAFFSSSSSPTRIREKTNT